MYFYDYFGKELRAYDPEHKCWGVVKGLDDFFAEMRRVVCFWPVTVSHPGKLVLFFNKQEIIGGDLLCGDFAGKRQRGSDLG